MAVNTVTLPGAMPAGPLANQSSAIGATPPTRGSPPHHLRRVARSIVIRAAVRGRISWFVAFRMLALIDGGQA